MVATDLSRFSGYAIGRAQIMADEQDAQIEIVHCLSDSLLQTIKDNLLGNPEQSQRALLPLHTKLLNRSTKRLLGDNLARVSTRLPQGDPDDILPDHADTIGARLVLLGAHGKGFVKSLLIGSITSRLIRTLRQPALVVKTPARSAYSNVLIAVDFSPASLQAIAISRQVAPSAHLTLVHLYDVPFAGMLRYAGIKSPDIAQYRHEIHAKDRSNCAWQARSAFEARTVDWKRDTNNAGTIKVRCSCHRQHQTTESLALTLFANFVHHITPDTNHEHKCHLH